MSETLSRRTVLVTTASAAALAATGPFAVPACASAHGRSRNKVLVVGMDGLCHDRLDRAEAPHIDSLITGGTFGTSLLYARPMANTDSGPGWSTISCGVWPDKHRVTGNDFGGDYGTYPPFMTRLAEVRPELSTYAGLSWTPLKDHGTFAGAKEIYAPSGATLEKDRLVTQRTVRLLREEEPDVLFVHLDNTDSVAHASGVNGADYFRAVATADELLGEMLDAIASRSDRDRWTVIVATDHGHVPQGGHGGSSIDERSTFVLAKGPGIPAGARPRDTRLVDVAATVFHQLGIVPDSRWELDGKPLQQRADDDFEALYARLRARKDEDGIPKGIRGWTHAAPSGWSVINKAMGKGGTAEWRGWSFATDDFWSRTRRDEQRELNIRARGIFAVADASRWASRSHSGRFDSTLVSPAHPVRGEGRVRLEYTSLYRHVDGQSAQVLASFNGRTPVVIDTLTEDWHSKVRSVTVPVPGEASAVSFHFRLTGDRSWFWTVDTVEVSAV